MNSCTNFFMNFVHKFKYEIVWIRTNSYEFFAWKIGYVTNGLYCKSWWWGFRLNVLSPGEGFCVNNDCPKRRAFAPLASCPGELVVFFCFTKSRPNLLYGDMVTAIYILSGHYLPCYSNLQLINSSYWCCHISEFHEFPPLNNKVTQANI